MRLFFVICDNAPIYNRSFSFREWQISNYVCNRIMFLETHPDVMIEVASIMHRIVDTQTTGIINYPIDRDAEREGKLG